MKPLALVIMLIVLSLGSAAPAVALRTSGPSPNTGSSDPNVETGLTAYVAAVQPAYAELVDCACCCDRLDLPSHRCAACRSAAASMRQVVARTSRIQRKLGRLDVPASLVPAHSRLIAALSTMRISGEYMAEKVLTAPETLVAVVRTGVPSGHGPFIRRPAPTIVRDARIAALASAAPAGVDLRLFLRQRYARSPVATVDSWGTPGEQASALLDQWRDDIVALAKEAGVSVPESVRS
jgi:hypothetical protein